LLGIVAAVFLSRLPFLFNGYGDDPDAWRMVETARLLATDGSYQPSRFPGYPLPEFTYGALYWLGLTAAEIWNGITAALSSVAAAFFYLIYSKDPRRPTPVLATLAMALVPVLYIQSTASMDYAWALCFTLGSALLILEGRVLAGGVFLGLAIACRLTSGAFLLPAILLIGVRPVRLREIMLYGVTCALVAGLFYFPAIAKFGVSFLTFSDSYPSLAVVVARATIRTFGPVGAVAMAAAVAIAVAEFLRNSREAMERMRRSGTAAPAAVYCCMIAALYLRLPHEAAYLIPLIPFGLLVLADLVRPKVMIGLYAVLAVSPFIGNLDNFGRLSLQGMILRDAADRQSKTCIAAKGAAYAASLPPGEYLIAVHFQPYLQIYLTDNPAARDRVIYGVASQNEQGFEIFGSAARPDRETRFHILGPAAAAVSALDFYRDPSFTTVEISGCER
jgi:hypothetical protein